MNIKCTLGFHSWKNCICSNCGTIRDEQHNWEKNCEKCSICGKTRDNEHKFQLKARSTIYKVWEKPTEYHSRMYKYYTPPKVDERCYLTLVCSLCGYSRIGEIQPDHQMETKYVWDDDKHEDSSKCIKIQHCSYCGFERLERVDHQYRNIDSENQSISCVRKQICIQCGNKRDHVEHDFGNSVYKSVFLGDFDANDKWIEQQSESYQILSDSRFFSFCGLLRKCKVCGEFDSKIVFQGEHDFHKDHAIESSGCSGIQYKCLKCGSTKDIYNHEFKSEWVCTEYRGNRVEATQIGYTEYKCIHCDLTFRIPGYLNYGV